jgi:polysaccharide deacetylase family protein (PEP-CTERM system associated)
MHPSIDQPNGFCVGTEPAALKPMAHVISVDVEDYYQVEAFSDTIDRKSWDNWPSRVVSNTHRALDLLDRYSTKATFFFVGWIAHRFPSLVREVEARGHELACHSYWHRPVYSLTPSQFREDTREAKDVVEQAAGVRIIGYRAPTWSITKNCLWALDILAEEEFVYDSSIFPIKHDLYGDPDAQRLPYIYVSRSGLKLREFPPATIRIAGLNLPGAGGGYLRVFPVFYTLWMFRQAEKKRPHPLVVYFHPWELDPGQPRIREKLKSRLRHYTHLDSMQSRLSLLLQSRSFLPFCELLRIEKQQKGKQENDHAILSPPFAAALQ